jgi:hypothetical protein
LEKELKFVNKTKEAYVKAHPEARERVFGKPRRPGQGQSAGGEEGESGAGAGGERRDERLYDEAGKLRDPTRSVYYDPVYNPWGVPPPGMPYQERRESGVDCCGGDKLTRSECGRGGGQRRG